MESNLVSKKYQYNIPKQVYNILYINEDNIKSFLFRKENTNILFDYKDNKLPYEIIKLIDAINTDISIYALINLMITHLYLYIIEVESKYKNDLYVLIVQCLCKIYYSTENSRFKCIEALLYNKCSHGKKCARCVRNVKPSEYSIYDDALHRTRPCITFCVTGKCIYDINCMFSHVTPIITNKGITYDPPVENIYVPVVAPVDETSPLYKTSLCRQYENNNYCEKGDLCTFAHGNTELRLNPLRCKKIRCNEFLVKGRCVRGHSCPFFHEQWTGVGHNTAIDRGIRANYKTVPCKWYHNNNSCKFGVNCLYIHS